MMIGPMHYEFLQELASQAWGWYLGLDTAILLPILAISWAASCAACGICLARLLSERLRVRRLPCPAPMTEQFHRSMLLQAAGALACAFASLCAGWCLNGVGEASLGFDPHVAWVFPLWLCASSFFAGVAGLIELDDWHITRALHDHKLAAERRLMLRASESNQERLGLCESLEPAPKGPGTKRL